MCLFADSSRLSLDEIFLSFLFFSLRLPIQRINSRFIFAPFSSSGAGVHSGKTKELSGLGLIPMPKCFTANVITSAQVPRFRAPHLFPVVFYFQVSFWCHPLLIPLEDAILRMLFRGRVVEGSGSFILVGLKSIFQLKDCVLSESWSRGSIALPPSHL